MMNVMNVYVSALYMLLYLVNMPAVMVYMYNRPLITFYN